MNQYEIDPPIENFVVFSGGGGLITREMDIDLQQGKNQITVREVPASFDPETFVIEFDDPRVELSEFVIKKPNRQYVDDNLRREGACAQRLIEGSMELGRARPQILEVCEAVSLRTYIDEEVYLVVWLQAPAKMSGKLTLSYFIDDVRFKWKPTLIVELDEDWESCRVKGFIAITNESARRFDDVEVAFADFAKDMNEDAVNVRLEPEEFKVKMKKQRMKMMQIK